MLLASLQHFSITSLAVFITATILPLPRGAAFAIKCPRLATRLTAVLKSSAPLATSAEYSPKLKPQTASALKPFSFNKRQKAILTVNIAGCVYCV